MPSTIRPRPATRSLSFDTLGLLDAASPARAFDGRVRPLSLQYWLQTATALDNSTAPQWKDVARDGRLGFRSPGRAHPRPRGARRRRIYRVAHRARLGADADDRQPPIITVLAAPDVVSHSSRNVSIAYCASTLHNTFLVELNGLVLFQTSSPTVTLPRLAPGNHTLSLTAIDAALLADQA